MKGLGEVFFIAPEDGIFTSALLVKSILLPLCPIMVTIVVLPVLTFPLISLIFLVGALCCSLCLKIFKVDSMDVSLAAAIASARFSRSVFLQPQELIVLNT